MKFITRKEIIMLLFLAMIIFVISTSIFPIVVDCINGDISTINKKIILERIISPDYSQTYIITFLIITTMLSINLLKTNLLNYINYKRYHSKQDNNHTEYK